MDDLQLPPALQGVFFAFRWVIMDGYHRLARLATSGVQQVRVRKHPAAYLMQIRR